MPGKVRKIDHEQIEKMKEALEPSHNAILDVSSTFKIDYQDAAALLMEHHINDMHAILMMWWKAERKFEDASR